LATRKKAPRDYWGEAIEVIPATETKHSWNRVLVATPKARPIRTEKRLVKIMTVGWKEELYNKNPSFEELKHDWMKHLDLDEEGTSLERMGCVRRFARWPEEMNPVLIQDASNLFETNERDKGHIGTNPMIMAKATNSPHFMLWIEKAKMTIQKDMQSSTGNAEIFITCATGTRRSVAAAALLKPVLEKMEGYRALPLENVSKTEWQQTCNGECPECANDEDVNRKLSMKHAEVSWAMSPPRT